MPAGHDISGGGFELSGVMYVSDDDDSIPGNAQFIIEDVYELSAPYGLELGSGALLSIQTVNVVIGQDSSGKFLEI